MLKGQSMFSRRVFFSVMGPLMAMCVVSQSVLGAERGNGSSGGGDVLVCRKGLGNNVHLADTFAFFRTEEGERMSSLFRKVSEEESLDAIVSVIHDFDPELGETLSQNLLNLEFIEKDEVDELDDDDIRVIPEGCKKVQLAIQDLATGKVEYNQKLYRKLSKLERALFKLHEAYIQVKVPKEDLKNTAPVRASVAAFAKSEVFEAALAKVRVSAPVVKFFDALGVRFVPPISRRVSEAAEEFLRAVVTRSYGKLDYVLMNTTVTTGHQGGQSLPIRVGQDGMDFPLLDSLHRLFKESDLTISIPKKTQVWAGKRAFPPEVELSRNALSAEDYEVRVVSEFEETIATLSLHCLPVVFPSYDSSYVKCFVTDVSF